MVTKNLRSSLYNKSWMRKQAENEQKPEQEGTVEVFFAEARPPTTIPLRFR